MSYDIAIVCGPEGLWFPCGGPYAAADDAIAALVETRAKGLTAHVIEWNTDKIVDIPSEQDCYTVAWGALTLAKYQPRSIHTDEDGTQHVLMRSGKVILHRRAVPGYQVEYWTTLRDLHKRYPNDREI